MSFDFHQPGVTILHGDVFSRLPELDDESVHCCVTSPPYWGLRDYGTARWVGGDPECDHLGEPFRTKANINANCGTGIDRKNAEARQFFRDECGKCGAVREDEQLGLEPTPEEYVKKIVAVFRQVRRVLRADGTLWLNLGDSYNNSDKWGGGKTNTGKHTVAADGSVPTFAVRRRKGTDCDPKRGTAAIGQPLKHCAGLKPKDLVGIPWMVAFALRADGWYLRQDIIWHKPNSMPESTKDRCTKAHEYIFLLSKSPRYFYNCRAIEEQASGKSGGASFGPQTKMGATKVDGGHAAIGGGIQVQSRVYVRPEYKTRNKRSVWRVPTKSYKGAHFATFPPKLIEPCILAGCPEGGTVLDPFNGSGTTGEVARKHGRNYIGIELNDQYIELSKQRFRQPVLF